MHYETLKRRVSVVARIVAYAGAMAVAAAGLAGCEFEDPELSGANQPIIGGILDTGDPAVVMTVFPSGFSCTGTLIAPRVVLTAAHCVEADILNDTIGGRVYFGSGENNEFDDSRRIINMWMYRYYNPANVTNYDIGLIQLAEDAPAEIEPLPFNIEPLGEEVLGRNVRVVGFGVTNGEAQTGGGTKRKVTLTIDSLSSVHIGLGDETKNICQGDSGGPTILSIEGVDTVVAVSSFGSNFCMDRSRVTRTDVYRELLLEVYDAWAGPCQFDGTCTTTGCRTPDPDCDICGFDGICGTGCAKLDLDCPLSGLAGALCDDSDDCETRRCIEAVDDARVKYCSDACDSSLPIAEACDAPLTVCDAAGGDGDMCRYDGITPSAQGWPCSEGSECRSNVCDPDHDICIEACSSDAECTDGFACESFGGGVSACTIPREGGGCCSTANRRPSTGSLALILGVGLWLAGAARRRRSRSVR